MKTAIVTETISVRDWRYGFLDTTGRRESKKISHVPSIGSNTIQSRQFNVSILSICNCAL